MKTAADKIRVLHVLTDANFGGAGRHLLTIFDEYDRQTFQMEAVLPKGSRLCEQFAARGIPFAEADYIADQSFSWRGVLALYKIFRDKRPDIAHTHAALSGRIAAKLWGKCKIIHTRHTAKPPSPSETRFPKRTASGFVNNLLSDAIIVVSPILREHLMATGTPGGKIRLIENGVPRLRALTEAEKENARAAFGIKPNTFVVCMAARLVASKGQEILLDAAAGLDESFVIVLAGDGPDHLRISKRIFFDDLKNVRMAGFVKDMASLYGIADAQVNASSGGEEAASLSLLEGLSGGVPAVASDTGGNPYVVAQDVNGLLFPDKDAAALRAALIRLRDDAALRQRLREGALKTYGERFTARVMVENIETLYRDVMKGVF
ncbi:MAG: glycosyltransferase family 4 protein [Clostridiales bacterium]|jgi:glycosyltransferase involved in cell wall biosynthesis|nr:glycosyltransferase family 4 protein [Clostridiales bacterium]